MGGESEGVGSINDPKREDKEDWDSREGGELYVLWAVGCGLRVRDDGVRLCTGSLPADSHTSAKGLLELPAL